MTESIKNETKKVITELLDISALNAGDILVVGCSSSEIVGEKIGKGSSYETAEAVFGEIYDECKKRGVFLAAQCCEHLNRAIIIEKECAEKYGLEPVCVVPFPKAGGSFASASYRSFDAPVAVEHIKAHAGLDIGGTLIGMHLREVAVPVRLSASKIGEANILCARTRPKYIGGERAHYTL
ncbi:MAG: TIGR01440 family protein [Eubacteriales bacterium]